VEPTCHVAWVRKAARVARAARPSAPPICWLVLTRPPATPAVDAGTPAMAILVTGTNAVPSSIPTSKDGPRTLARNVPSAGAIPSQAKPPMNGARPAASTMRDPSRAMSGAARPAAAISVRARGIWDSPPTIGPYPRMTCSYRDWPRCVQGGDPGGVLVCSATAWGHGRRAVVVQLPGLDASGRPLGPFAEEAVEP